MGMIQASVILLTVLAAGHGARDHPGNGDLEAVESRYKVVAKPEPYKPPRPAPDDFEITTRRGIDGAEVIYPTTTYRPVNLYLPTKGSEKFLHEFGKVGDDGGKKVKGSSSEETSDSGEKEKPGSKKRIKKVRKVLRNSAARQQKSRNRGEKKGSAEVKSLLPTVTTPRPTPPTTPTPPRTTRPTTLRTTPTPPATTQRPKEKQQSQFFHQHRTTPDPELETSEQEEKTLLHHPGDFDIRSNKKARGLAILNQLSGRPPLPPPPQPQIPSFLPPPVAPAHLVTPSTIINEVLDDDYPIEADYDTYQVS